MLRSEVVLSEDSQLEDSSQTITSPASRLVAKSTYSHRKLVIEYDYAALTNVVAVADIANYVEALDDMRAALSYSLTWPNENAPLSLARFNWPIATIGSMYFIGAIVGAVMLYRKSVPVAGEFSAPPPLPHNLNGLGGWLILVGLGLVLSPFSLFRSFVTTFSAYGVDTWTAVTSPGTKAYHPLWAPYLICALLANLTLLVSSGLLVILFFQRRKIFPRLYIAFLGFLLVTAIGDAIATLVIPAAAAGNESAIHALTRAGIACLVWIPYMLTSNRVKFTFVK